MRQYSLFYQERVSLAIERIRKFARLSEAMGYDVRVGFSGGKDSQVVYDLCKKKAVSNLPLFTTLPAKVPKPENL